MAARLLIIGLFLLSAVYLPWWVTVPLGIALIAWFRDWQVAVLGGFFMDIVFGAPVASLAGFAYLYTALFGVLALLAAFLRKRMLE